MRVAGLPACYALLSIVETAQSQELDPHEVAQVHFALGERLALPMLVQRIQQLPRDDRWQTMARAALRDDLYAVHAELTLRVLAPGEHESAERRVADWEEERSDAVAHAVRMLEQICLDDDADLARMSVALRVVRAACSTEVSDRLRPGDRGPVGVSSPSGSPPSWPCSSWRRSWRPSSSRGPSWPTHFFAVDCLALVDLRVVFSWTWPSTSPTLFFAEVFWPASRRLSSALVRFVRLVLGAPRRRRPRRAPSWPRRPTSAARPAGRPPRRSSWSRWRSACTSPPSILAVTSASTASA